MKKKLLLAGAVVMMAAAAVTGYTAYSETNASLLMANVNALADSEDTSGGESGGGYYNARTQYCLIPSGVTGCVTSAFRNCNVSVFCVK